MTFDELWPTLVIPGEYDMMDACDKERWRGVIEQAFEAGRAQIDTPHQHWLRSYTWVQENGQIDYSKPRIRPKGLPVHLSELRGDL